MKDSFLVRAKPQRREEAQVIVIASEARQSSGDGGTGLPRFARNDEVCVALFLLNPDVDLDYLEKRIREESFGDYGIEDIRT